SIYFARIPLSLKTHIFILKFLEQTFYGLFV
uniref:Odorant receptor n=1 Tax=Strongyloides papillosus TaxID=174720 RepID=A0A0N5CIE8_STREA